MSGKRPGSLMRANIERITAAPEAPAKVMSEWVINRQDGMNSACRDFLSIGFSSVARIASTEP